MFQYFLTQALLAVECACAKLIWRITNMASFVHGPGQEGSQEGWLKPPRTSLTPVCRASAISELQLAFCCGALWSKTDNYINQETWTSLGDKLRIKSSQICVFMNVELQGQRLWYTESVEPLHNSWLVDFVMNSKQITRCHFKCVYMQCTLLWRVLPASSNIGIYTDPLLIF